MKTIAWDVDDTLNDLMRLWLETWHLPRRGRLPAAGYDELLENPPYRPLGLTKAAYMRSYDAFRLSGVYDTMNPLPEVRRWFRLRGHKYRHIAITAVPLSAAHVSAGWVLRHFGRWIRTFHVVPTARPGVKPPAYDRSKAEWLKRAGGCDIFLDDSPANLAPAAKDGIKCLLVPRPWNGGKGTLAELLAKL